MLDNIRPPDTAVGAEKLTQPLRHVLIGQLQAEIVRVGVGIRRDMQMQVVAEVNRLRGTNLFPQCSLAGCDIYDPDRRRHIAGAARSYVQRLTVCAPATGHLILANSFHFLGRTSVYGVDKPAATIDSCI